MRFPILFAASIALPVVAQTTTDRATVNWGPELKERENGEFNRLIGLTDDAVFMTMTQKRDLHVQKMNSDLVSLYTEKLDLELDKKELSLLDVMVIDRRILVFATRFDRKDEQTALYMRVFDEATMAPQAEWDRLCRFEAKSGPRSGGFGVVVSPDERRVLVWASLPYEKNSPERFQVKVYSSAIELEWDREIALPYIDKEFSIEEFDVDVNGDVVVVGVKYAERAERRERKRDGKAQYDYHLLTFSGAGGEKDHTIALSDKFLQDMTVSLDTGKSDILCAGFYGEKGSNAVRGSFFLRLDPTTKAITHQSHKAFSDDFITLYMTEKEEKKARDRAERKDENLQLFEYDLDEIVRRTDGGAVLVGEQYYLRVTSYTSRDANGNTYTTTVYHYYYNDIIVVNIDPDGTIAWTSRIPKRQHTTNDGGYFSSYALEVKGDKLYFVYNDNGKNLFLKPGDKFEWTDFAGKNSIVTLATVDAYGEVTREALLDPEKRDLIVRPKSCLQMKDDRMFLFATRGKDYRFGTAEFR